MFIKLHTGGTQTALSQCYVPGLLWAVQYPDQLTCNKSLIIIIVEYTT